MILLLLAAAVVGTSVHAVLTYDAPPPPKAPLVRIELCPVSVPFAINGDNSKHIPVGEPGVTCPEWTPAPVAVKPEKAPNLGHKAQ